METAICQFSDAQFKMSNFVVNQSHFKSIYDGIIDLTKMVQGNDSFFFRFFFRNLFRWFSNFYFAFIFFLSRSKKEDF